MFFELLFLVKASINTPLTQEAKQICALGVTRRFPPAIAPVAPCVCRFFYSVFAFGLVWFGAPAQRKFEGMWGS